MEQLTSLEAPVVDRAICERIFGVKRRRAIDLMQRFGGYQAGNAVLIDRLELIRQLQIMAESPDADQERARKKRLSTELVKLEKHRRAAAVRIQVGPEAASCTVADLPHGVSLGSGRLTVEYNGIEQLLARLYELSQAVANDFDGFSAAAGESSSLLSPAPRSVTLER
jgi:hypothetical protein